MRVLEEDVDRGLAAAVEALSDDFAVAGFDGSVVPLGRVGTLGNARVPIGLDGAAAHAFALCVEHARLSEIRGPGSSEAVLRVCSATLRSPSAPPAELVGRRCIRRDVAALVAVALGGESADFEAALELAGASRCTVDRRPGRADSVELARGYEFVHASKPADRRAVLRRPRVLVVDGYVESASEAHRVLDGCSRAGDALLVCCRGSSDDVAHTVAVNRARGTLQAYVLTFPYDLDDANTLVDVATLLGDDVVSSLKGQLISTVDPSALPRVDEAVLLGDRLELHDRFAEARAERHRATLLERLLEPGNSSSREMLEPRIRRLAGTRATVRLRGTLDHVARCDRWDQAFRIVQAAARGVIEPSGEGWRGARLVPLISAVAAVELGAVLAAQLRSLSAVV